MEEYDMKQEIKKLKEEIKYLEDEIAELKLHIEYISNVENGDTSEMKKRLCNLEIQLSNKKKRLNIPENKLTSRKTNKRR